MCLSAVTLCPLTKKATVMFQCFDHIILRLVYGDIFWDQTSHLVPTQDVYKRQAEISIPQESMPIMGRGGRLVMATQVLPTSSSGS